MVSSTYKRTKKILISGFIDLNVIDGSAFFIAGLAAMCASHPNLEVKVVSAVKLVNMAVLDEILDFENVEIIDPFDDVTLLRSVGGAPGVRLDRGQYAGIISAVSRDFNPDSIIIRDTETGFHFAKKSSDFVSRLAVYVTGISSLDDGIATTVRQMLEYLRNSGTKLLFQTPEMLCMLKAEGLELSDKQSGVLPPHVPDGISSSELDWAAKGEDLKIVYSGKFFYGWNTDRIFAAFKALVLGERRNISFYVAGDQFRHSKEEPNFVANTKYLLKTTPNLYWFGGVPRAVSREIIRNCHVGISWRRDILNRSTELSTKVLEYGSLGVPAILNPTASHKALLSSDYPLFADTMSEFKRVIRAVDVDKGILDLAAERCHTASKRYWYSNVLPEFIDFVVGEQELGPTERKLWIGSEMRTPAETDLSRKVFTRVEGPWLIYDDSRTADASLAEAINEQELIARSWKNSISDKQRERAELRPVEAEYLVANSPEPNADANNLEGAEESAFLKKIELALRGHARKLERHKTGAVLIKHAKQRLLPLLRRIIR